MKTPPDDPSVADAKIEFRRPFPALTGAERIHFETCGYVVVPDVFSRDECERMREALCRLRADLIAASPAEPQRGSVRGAVFEHCMPHHAFMANFHAYDDDLLSYACHPRIVGMCEEILGCPSRLTELNGHLNSRPPDLDLSKPPDFGFHTGVDIAFGSHTHNGLYHCNFVKALTNLTDLGPDDGGTVVVAGSHKLPAGEKEIIAAAYEDRSLIHQVIAPAGSVLLFPETLIHATGQLRSDKERAIIIAAHSPRLYQRWDRYSHEPTSDPSYSPGFTQRIPTALRPLFLGAPHWDRQPRYRTLSAPRDEKTYAAVPWLPGSPEDQAT
ncbi:MAG: phytanoyl-CoA dioxygenase family protein [Verrucomicrobia bacterium]|nr:phytanoyl-CoA dioxygenase family protein [Verrucomicrobiota bacterium]